MSTSNTTVSTGGLPSRRNTELAMLVFAVVIPVFAYANVGLAVDDKVPAGLLGYGLGLGAMGVKGVRLGRGEGWRVLRRGLWGNGVHRAWRDLRNGYQAGALSSLVRTGGVLVGMARGVRRPLLEERFS